MPIYEYECRDCGKAFEVIVSGSADSVCCAHCGSRDIKKKFSAHAAISGSHRSHLPGPGDTTCCGSSPGTGSCAGPGSCCGKA
ncbi:MAG: zinc ribbon domain-containing protein [Desulfobacterales bacterium]